jgi:hypothetical protein
MSVEELLAMTGAYNLLDPYFWSQLGTAALNGLIFLATLAVGLSAFRAARSAHRARREAYDLAVEVRRLTAQIENATARRATVETDGDADGERLPDLPTADLSEPQIDERQIEEATAAATVPTSLLSRFRKRR